MKFIRYFIILGLALNIYTVVVPAVRVMFIDQALGSWLMNFVSIIWSLIAIFSIFALYEKYKFGLYMAIFCFITQIPFYRVGVEFYGINRGFLEFELTIGHRFEYWQFNLTPLLFLFLAWFLWARNLDNEGSYIIESSTEETSENA